MVRALVLSILVCSSAVAAPNFGKKPNTHECAYHAVACNTTVQDEVDIFGCEADGYYVNVHSVTLTAGTTIQATLRSNAFSSLIGLAAADSEDFLVTNAAAIGGSAVVTYTVARTALYEIWVAPQQRVTTGAYTLSITCTTAPPPPTNCAACTPNSTTACMLDNRFKVTATWSDGSFGSGAGLPIRFAENKPQTHPEHGAILETTFFAFYPFFPTSVESMVKMTKGVGINNKYWVFITGFTGASYTVNIQDTKTCATWSKAMAPNATAALRDYEAFPLN